MRCKLLFLFIVFLFVGILPLFAQGGATNVEIQNENVKISAVEDIQFSTGNSGKVYYNNNEVAVKGESGRSATIIIAASNASEKSKAGADYVCTGENDHLIIQKVLDELKETGGSISFSEGTFYLQSQVIPSGKIKMSGQGSATVITGKEPSYRPYLGMIMCGDDLDLIVSEMSFLGNGDGWKAITCEHGPLWGEPDYIIKVGKNIKSINLQNLIFTDFGVRPINIAGDALIKSMMVSNVTLRNVPDLYFGPIEQLVVNNLFVDSTCPNSQIRFGDTVKNFIATNIISESKILIKHSGTVSSCRCRLIELTNTTKNCIVFGNKTTSGITNRGSNNHLFNNY